MDNPNTKYMCTQLHSNNSFLPIL